MTKLLLFFFYVLSSRAQITNMQDVCSQLRSNLFKSINLYQNMSHNDREELFKFSLREFTITLLQNIEFEDEEKNQLVEDLIGKSRTYMYNYLQLQNFTSEDFQKEYSKLEKAATKASDLLMTKFQELQVEEAKLDGFKSELEQLRTSLTQSNFNGVYTMYQGLSGILTSLKSASLDSSVLISILEEFEKRFEHLYSEDAVHAKKIRAEQTDYLFLKDLLETNDEVQTRFKLPESQELIKNLKALKKSLSTKQSLVNSDKKKLIKKIEAHVSSSLDLMTQSQNYKKFKSTLEQAKKCVKKVQELRFEHLNLQKDFNAKDFKLELSSLKQVRLNSRDYIKLEPQLYNLGQLTEMTDSNLTEDAEIEPEVDNNRRSFYGHNTARQQEITEKYEQLRAQSENMQNLRYNEKEIDKLFGEVVAYLQGSLSPSQTFEKCFTTLELSVLFYYSSLFQFVVCKKSFLRAFLAGIPDSDQLAVVKQIFKDLREDSFTDLKMINMETGQFSPGGVEQAVLNYDMFMNEEYDEIFKIQLSDREKLKNKIATVLSYAGISGKFILKNVLKVGFKVLFVSLAAALAVFITVSIVPGLLSILIIGLAVLLIKLVYNWVGHLIRKNAHLRNDFMRGLSRFISRFTSKQIETLDYNSILNETTNELMKKKMAEAESQNAELTQVNLDRTKYFKEKFAQIIQMTITSDSIDYIDVYDGLM